MKVMAITGMMMINISTTEIMMRSRCWRATSPEGENSTASQPDKSRTKAGISNPRIIFMDIRMMEATVGTRKNTPNGLSRP
jgi:hypothetical protein